MQETAESVMQSYSVPPFFRCTVASMRGPERVTRVLVSNGLLTAVDSVRLYLLEKAHIQLTLLHEANRCILGMMDPQEPLSPVG